MLKEHFLKKYIIWIYFFTYPLVNAFLPDVDAGVIRFNPYRLFLLFPVFYLLFLFIENRGRVKISKENVFLALYAGFAVFNSWRTGNFAPSEVINYSFPLLLFILFDNLDFNRKDIKNFYRMISLLALLVFIVSLIQNFYSHSFYSGIRGARWLLRYTYAGSHFRHASLFRSIDFYQAGVAMGVLFMIFLFRNSSAVKPLNVFFCFLLSISIYYTYTRSNWLIALIALVWFFILKPLKQKIIISLLATVVLLFVFLKFFPDIQESEVFRERVTVSTYEGRFVSFNVYMDHFWGKNMVLGHGVDSYNSGAFRPYGRPEVHIGYLELIFRNGFLGATLYFIFWYYFFRRGLWVFGKTGNAVFIAFISVLAAINLVYKFININHYGFHMIIFYLHMLYSVHFKESERRSEIETA